MWELVTRFLWLPLDIMQRMSQRVLLLGRSIYGGLFGPTSKPALTPPPSTSVSQQQSCQRTTGMSMPLSCSVIATAKCSTLPDTPHCVIDMERSVEAFVKENPDPGKDRTVLSESILSDVETFTLLSETGAAVPRTNDIEMSSSPSSKTTTTDGIDDVKQLNACAEIKKPLALEPGNVSSPVASAEPAKATVLTSGGRATTSDCTLHDGDTHADADVTMKNKRLPERQKRRQVTKQNDFNSIQQRSKIDSASVDTDGTTASQDDFQIQAKKPKLSEETVSSKLEEKEGAKRNKKKRSKKNKKLPDQASGEGDTMWRPRAPPPNFFIAIQISNKEIIAKVSQFQKALAERKLSQPWHDLRDMEIFKDAMVPVAKLHFTLHVMHLKGLEDIERAQQALAECGQEVHQEFIDEPMDLTIEGLGHFKNNVIFAQIKDKGHIARLTRISELFRKKFSEFNISVDPRPFNPHMTIAKISRSNKLYKRKIRSFPPDIWSDIGEEKFGVQRVTSLQLLQMAGEDKVTGYYNCLGQYFFEDPLIFPTNTENMS